MEHVDVTKKVKVLIVADQLSLQKASEMIECFQK